ncbi:hypothetical protein EAH79_07225 [Sphingomonas koreensis]|nr:hypothetical protein EAH79_07225 [Sphingomonas koreensis]
MFERISHIDGIISEQEILFSTKFDYMFPDVAHSRLCLLPSSTDTVAALKALGQAIGTPGDTLAAPGDSAIPAIFTYFGQFIDHDITARTDRDDIALTFLGQAEPIAPLDPDIVVAKLHNGRRPQLDLDNVFGDAPAFAGSGPTAAQSESQQLFESDYRLKVYASGSRRDVPRDQDCVAIIPDMRNDENINISQLQCAFLNFYNRIRAGQPNPASDAQKHIRARTLTRWAYQYVVVHDYLKTVCDPAVVEDTLANGPRYFGATAGHADAYMPLEFSTAAFRFGHSMIRPSYNLNATTQNVGLDKILGPGKQSTKSFYFDAGQHQIKQAVVIDFEFYARGGAHLQFARKIDSQIAHGLDTLPLAGRDDPVLSNLAKSNLLRGYNLSVPTAQGICDAMGLYPLTTAELIGGEVPAIADVLSSTYLDRRTPLWYYILREAAVQQDGQRLGELGSRLVCETIIGMLKGDPNSYLNNRHDPDVKSDGIDVKPGAGGKIQTLVDMLNFAQVASI